MSICGDKNVKRELKRETGWSGMDNENADDKISSRTCNQRASRRRVVFSHWDKI